MLRLHYSSNKTETAVGEWNRRQNTSKAREPRRTGRIFLPSTENTMNTKKLLQAIGTSIVIGMGLAVLMLVLKTLIWIYTL